MPVLAIPRALSRPRHRDRRLPAERPLRVRRAPQRLLDEAVAQGARPLGPPRPSASTAAWPAASIPIIASERRVGIDLHLHDSGEDVGQMLTILPRRTRATTWRARSRSAVPCATTPCSRTSPRALADTPGQAASRSCRPSPGTAAMPPGCRCSRAHGVEVFGGSDDIRRSWSPFGNGDILQTLAMLISYRGNFRHDKLELAPMVTAAAAACSDSRLRHQDRRPGQPGGCRGGTLAEAVAARPRKCMMKAVRIITRIVF